MQHSDIIIIGGGVSGITTALTLQLLGYSTKVFTEHLVDNQAPSDPRFASLYPAASVIPHSVQTDQLDTLFPPSQTIFEFLFREQLPFMKLHRHYEVHEFPVEDPLYAGYLNKYKRVENSEDRLIPRYSGITDLFGWSFNCLVAEWPDYMKQLYRWYREAGGSLIRQKITQDNIAKLKGNLIVNCSGIWSTGLFREPEVSAIERGHILFFPGAPLITGTDGTIISYNYTPQPAIYADPQGNPSDVYFYPRSNGWVLGGSRQTGTIDEGNNFEGKGHANSLTHSGISFPRQILELNKKILKETYNIDQEIRLEFEPKIGYRFNGNADNPGLQINYTEFRNRKIIHNYGHGGAGVTLSWGCALEVAKIIRYVGAGAYKKTDDRPDSVILNRLQNRLMELAPI